MKERLIWIDWAKALAVCCVVFCHLPQSQDWFYYRFLQANIITIFFFICELTRSDGIRLVDDAALQHLVTGEERVDDVLVLVRRTHLHIDGVLVIPIHL